MKYIRPEKNRKTSRTSGSAVDDDQLVRECTTKKVVIKIKNSEIVKRLEKVVCLNKKPKLVSRPPNVPKIVAESQTLANESFSAVQDILETSINDVIRTGVTPKDKPKESGSRPKDPDKP